MVEQVGALAAARALLNNPPGPGAPPEAAEQWRADVDQLVAAATPSPNKRGHAHRSHVAPEQLAASHRSPSVARVPSSDLRAELDHRRQGEDRRVTIERQRERRRNLEAAFDAPDPSEERNAGYHVGSLTTGAGCEALAPHL